jgi:hypothetical protein
MKKKLALLGALGVAGGLFYALESNHRRNKAGNTQTKDDNGSSAGEDDSARPRLDANRGRGQQTETAASMARIEDGAPLIGDPSAHEIDDQGTDQAQASQILRSIRDNVFDASDEKLALALGRPTQEIEEWTGGNGLIDGDVLMKARTLGMQRGFEA